MNTGNRSMRGTVKKALTGFPMRARIALAIFLAFVVVLPVITLSLLSFSGLTSTMRAITERDVRLGKTGEELVQIMRDAALMERNYRIFGGTVDRAAVERLIGRADSLLLDAERVSLPREQVVIRDLSRKLDEYRNGFARLVLHVEKNPPREFVKTDVSVLTARVTDFEAMMGIIRMELRRATPAQRDSLLAETQRELDLFSLDLASGLPAGRRAEQLSDIQDELDRTRDNFREAADRFADLNWQQMYEDGQTALHLDARAKRNVIFVLILTAMLSFFMIIRLPGYIAKPITSLSTMLHRTTAGVLDTSAPVSSHDEIGELAVSYNQARERLLSYDDLKTKKIASQKRSIDRLIDYLNVPVCLLSRNMVAMYYNSQFAGLFGTALPSRSPDSGIDLTKIPEALDFVEQIRKRTAQAGGDFRFSAAVPGGREVYLKGRPVRNVALNIETIIVIGDEQPAGGEG